MIKLKNFIKINNDDYIYFISPYHITHITLEKTIKYNLQITYYLHNQQRIDIYKEFNNENELYNFIEQFDKRF